MLDYEKRIALPKIGETITTHDSTYTVLAAKEDRMLLVRYNNHSWNPLTYVVAFWPEATEGPLGERDFHWGQGHYFDVYLSDGGNVLLDAVQDFNEE